MAVAFDVASTGQGNGVNNLALSAMTTTGTNRLIIVNTHVSSTATITSITGGGLTFAKIGSTVAIPTAGGRIEVWRSFASLTLTSTVFTVNTSGGFPQITAVASAYSGTDTTGTSGSGAIGNTNTASTASNTSLSAAVTTTRNNSLVIAGAGTTSLIALTAGTGQTLNATNPTTGGFSVSAQERQNAVTASSGTSVTGSINSALAAPMAIFTIEVLDPGSAPATNTGSTLLMMGV